MLGNFMLSMMFWFKTSLFFGLVFLAGALTTVQHLLTLKPVVKTS